jgi:hypothetical protein
MTAEISRKASLKQKAAREFKKVAVMSLYLACFFCTVATYNMLLLNDFQSARFRYSFSLVNALVIAKVIILGEQAHVGKRYEGKPLFVSAIYKAFLFAMLALAFHGVEELIRARLHSENVVSALRETRIDQLLVHTLIVFFAFIFLFAFLELRRRLGEDNFRALVYGAETDRAV